MPTNHAAVAALPISAKASQTLIRNLIEARLAYIIASGAEAQGLVATDPTTGATVQVLMLFGRNYLYDAADVTTAHDGTTCLVSFDARRYKLAVGYDIVAYAVLDRINTPPGAPVLGDAYLITAAPTGAWAGKADYITVWTARGWEFINPEVGRFVYVKDEDAYYHRITAGGWAVGFGTQALGNNAILPSNMLGGGDKVRWIVQNQTTNAPPGAGADSVTYIIGPAPTGAWAGQAGKLAHRENGVWVIYTPQEGWRAYDKAQDQDFLYDGAAWATATGAMKVTRIIYTANDTWTKADYPRIVFAFIGVQAGGGGGGNGGTGGTGGTSSFGAHASATGGVGGNGTTGAPGAAGVGSSGDLNMTGGVGVRAITPASTTVEVAGGSAGGQLGGQYGNGGSALASPTQTACSGSAGGGSYRYRLASALGATEAVTVGAAGAAGGTGNAGKPGAVMVDIWQLT